MVPGDGDDDLWWRFWKTDPLPIPSTTSSARSARRLSVLDDRLAELRALLRRRVRSGGAGRARRPRRASITASTRRCTTYRKALRRARAVLTLVARALPQERAPRGHAARCRRRAARSSTRAITRSRRRRWRKLALADEERAHRPARARQRRRGDARASTEIKQLLAEGAARAAAQVEALEAALPHDARLVGRATGVARRSTPRLAASRRARQRVEAALVPHLAPPQQGAGLPARARRRPRRAARHRRSTTRSTASPISLAPAVDLIMLRDFVATYGRGSAPRTLDHLVAAIDGQLADLMKDARKRRPRQRSGASRAGSRKRLAKAIKRDLTPADDATTDGEQAHD